MNKAARNEQTKLLATWLNGGAVAALAVGCFAPITGFVTTTNTVGVLTLVLLVGDRFVASVSPHVIPRVVLRMIEE